MKTRITALSSLIFVFGLLLVACGADTPNPSPNSGAILPAQVSVTATAVPTSTTAAPTETAVPPTATAAPEPTETAVPTETSEPTATAVVAATPTREPSATATLVPTTRPPATPTPVRTTPAPPKATATPRPTILTTPYSGSLTEVVRGKTGKKQVAITLDAGAGADPFPKMLAALNKAGVKITFFLTGAWAQQNPTFVQQMVSNGHEIANHTWSHPDLTTVDDARIKDEIERTDALLSKFTGHSTRPLWRAPYGSRNAHVMSIVNEMGYRSIYWTIDSLDSVGEVKTPQFLIDRITKQSDAQLDGEIILMHIGSAPTAEALPTIIQNLQGRGFKIVTVSELLK